ncbi:MAG: glycosyltransferase family 4 protein [Planctomycetota bacterium]|nr:glycosyltransferase family 4 protein [Planctomycetota bacterium]
MRIALVSREYPPFFGGGIGSYARHIAPALAEAGHEVHVVTQTFDETHPRFAVEGHAGRLMVHRAPCPGDPAGWTSLTMRFATLASRIVARLAREKRIDVVEFAECEGAGAVLTALRAAGCPIGAPTVVHLHTPTEMLFRLGSIHDKTLTAPLAAYLLSERISIRMCDHICAPSAFIAKWAREHYELPTLPTVIPYAIEGVPPLSPPAARNRVLYVGRIEPRKGVEPLLLAWTHIAERHPAWTLRLVGRDTSTAQDGRSMRAYVSSLIPESLRSRVEFVDALPPESLHREYAEASICVIPSLWENFPNTCIEALSHARPVVVSDRGGMMEMVGDTDAGLSFASGDHIDLGRTLDRMMSESPDRLAARGMRGRRRIAQMCDKSAVVAARIRMYERAVADTEPRRSRPTPDRVTARLALWRQMRDAAGGNLDTLDLPSLPETMSRWLTPGAAA